MVKAVLNYNPRAQYSANADGFPAMFHAAKNTRNPRVFAGYDSNSFAIFDWFVLSMRMQVIRDFLTSPSRKVRKVRRVQEQD